MNERSPSHDGFSMPAEWQPHTGCLISWPCAPETWHGHIRQAEVEYQSVIEAVNRFEPVTVLSDPSTVVDVREKSGDGAPVIVVDLDDSWIRDNGPIFVTSAAGDVALVDFLFNAWGSKGPHSKDERVPESLSRELRVRRYVANMVLEGGSISVDGEGTLMTTEQCLLNPNRNPSMDGEQIEGGLKDFLGVSKVLWLGRGQAEDVTDGHVDGVACFSGPKTVIIAHTDDTSDPNHDMLAENRARLETSTDAKGRSIEIIDLVQPRPREHLGHDITPGYINHYVANGGIVAPEFGIPEDPVAAETLRSCYPDREVVTVSVPCIEVGGGGIHCITQQIPEGRFIRG
ncbi:MAG: agmatine deiminase family protein [Methanobacteriota archaeon]|nr:MAG: agmatine deiminase family protein [Euryarchaeota archaeon]